MYRMPRAPSHGSFCRIRSFQTKCPECGSPTLYWECYHGVRVFFDYPIYGKPIRHICPTRQMEKIAAKSGKPKYGSFKVLKTFQEMQEESAEGLTGKYRCPVCNNRFLSLDQFLSHIHELKKRNEKHQLYFNRFEYIPINSSDHLKSNNNTTDQANSDGSTITHEPYEPDKNDEPELEESDLDLTDEQLADFDFDFDSLSPDIEDDIEYDNEDNFEDEVKYDEDDDNDDFFDKFEGFYKENKENKAKFNPEDYFENVLSDNAKKGRHFGFVPNKKGKYIK